MSCPYTPIRRLAFPRVGVDLGWRVAYDARLYAALPLAWVVLAGL